MAASRKRVTRRAFLAVAAAAGRLIAQTPARNAAPNPGSRTFPSDAKRFADAATELVVFRLTDPSYGSFLPANYSRAVTRNGASLLFACDRLGPLQAFRMDLKTGEMQQLTETDELDPESLTFTPDNRAFCYFAGRTLRMALASGLRDREIYTVPEGWTRCAGMSVGADGTHATFAERSGDRSRLRMVSLAQGSARTVIEQPFAIEHPQPRPNRAQTLYRQGDTGLWLVNSDGRDNRQLKLAPGRVADPKWADDGRTLQYLNLPNEPKELHAIRDFTPDTSTDKLVAKTSQFASFSANHDTSVFVGASANSASPDVLLLLRVTRRELTICEHRATRPEAVCPIFSPDSQRVYFQSDREGKSAIYSMHVERLVERTEVSAA